MKTIKRVSSTWKTWTKMMKYNAEDAVRTAQIRQCQLREFREDKDDLPRLTLLHEQQKRLAIVAGEMAYKGFPVDQGKRRALSIELTQLARSRAKEFLRLVAKYRKGPVRVNLRGGVNQNDFSAMIFRESSKPGIKGFQLEVPWSDKCRTDSGKPSVDKTSLLFLFAMDNTPDDLKEIIYASWQVNAPLKARNTFVDSDVVLSRIGPDGRMHASINSCGAETGRWSCSDPNLFNLSETQKEEDGSLRGDLPNIRAMYVAPQGFVICHRDFKAFEVEMIQHVTGDLPLRQMLDTGDVHTARARAFFNIPEGVDVPKGCRKQGKIVGLASQYHAGFETIFMKVLEQIQDAKPYEIAALCERFPLVHPGIAKHWTDSLAFAELNGYNETGIMHRRIYYPNGLHLTDMAPSAYGVQGTAADIANSAMVGRTPEEAKDALFERLHKDHPTSWLGMHCYDSFDVIAPIKEADRVLRLADECMSGIQFGGWEVRGSKRLYKSDAKAGQRWSDV